MARSYFFLSSVYLFVLLFSFDISAADNNQLFSLDKIKIDGNHAITNTELNQIFDSYLGKEISLQDQGFQEKIIDAINLTYVKKGFTYSRVNEIKVQKNVLHIKITEGHLKKIFVQDNLKEIPYLKYYIEKIEEIKPFNINEAEPYLLLIKRLLGRDITLIQQLLSPSNPEDKNLAEIYIVGYKKFNGSLNIDNYYNAHAQDGNSDVIFNKNYFAFADLSVTTMHPFSTPGFWTNMISSSGDSKYNYLSTSYKYQLNNLGTQVKGNASVEHFNFNSSGNLISAGGSIIHPIILTKQQQLELSSGADFIFLDRKTILQNKKHSQIQKINLTTNYKYNYKRKFWYNQLLSVYTGKGHGRDSSLKRRVDNKFFKITASAALRFKVVDNVYLDFLADAQYASKDLPELEYFTVNKNWGGRGFLANDVNGNNGASGTVELSKNYAINNKLLSSISPYGYVDMIKAQDKQNDIMSKGVSTGVGVNLGLINDLECKIEVSQPLLYKRTFRKRTAFALANKHKKAKVFLELTYNFAF
jgi:hemolysin activation/secretion protein